MLAASQTSHTSHPPVWQSVWWPRHQGLRPHHGRPSPCHRRRRRLPRAAAAVAAGSLAAAVVTTAKEPKRIQWGPEYPIHRLSTCPYASHSRLTANRSTRAKPQSTVTASYDGLVGLASLELHLVAGIKKTGIYCSVAFLNVSTSSQGSQWRFLTFLSVILTHRTVSGVS